VINSTDGGSTWSAPVAVPLPAGFNDAGYPTVTFDDQGHAYVGFMATKFLVQTPPEVFPAGGRGANQLLVPSYGVQANNGVFVAESDDGVAWNAPVAVAQNTFTAAPNTTVNGAVVGGVAVRTAYTPPASGALAVTLTTGSNVSAAGTQILQVQAVVN